MTLSIDLAHLRQQICVFVLVIRIPFFFWADTKENCNASWLEKYYRMQESNPGPPSDEPNVSVSTSLVDFGQLTILQIKGQPFFCSLFFFSDRRACQDFSNEKVTSRFFQTFLFLSSPKNMIQWEKSFLTKITIISCFLGLKQEMGSSSKARGSVSVMALIKDRISQA